MTSVIVSMYLYSAISEEFALEGRVEIVQYCYAYYGIRT